MAKEQQTYEASFQPPLDQFKFTFSALPTIFTAALQWWIKNRDVLSGHFRRNVNPVDAREMLGLTWGEIGARASFLEMLAYQAAVYYSIVMVWLKRGVDAVYRYEGHLSRVGTSTSWIKIRLPDTDKQIKIYTIFRQSVFPVLVFSDRMLSPARPRSVSVPLLDLYNTWIRGILPFAAARIEQGGSPLQRAMLEGTYEQGWYRGFTQRLASEKFDGKGLSQDIIAITFVFLLEELEAVMQRYKKGELTIEQLNLSQEEQQILSQIADKYDNRPGVLQVLVFYLLQYFAYPPMFWLNDQIEQFKRDESATDLLSRRSRGFLWADWDANTIALHSGLFFVMTLEQRRMKLRIPGRGWKRLYVKVLEAGLRRYSSGRTSAILEILGLQKLKGINRRLRSELGALGSIRREDDLNQILGVLLKLLRHSDNASPVDSDGLVESKGKGFLANISGIARTMFLSGIQTVREHKSAQDPWPGWEEVTSDGLWLYGFPVLVGDELVQSSGELASSYVSSRIEVRKLPSQPTQ